MLGLCSRRPSGLPDNRTDLTLSAPSSPPKKRLRADRKAQEGEWIERTNDYVIGSGCLKGKILEMEVVEDFESRPHKAVSFMVEREKEIREWNGEKMPKVLPGKRGMLQEEAQKRKAKQKGRQMRTGEREESGDKSLKKWLKV